MKILQNTLVRLLAVTFFAVFAISALPSPVYAAPSGCYNQIVNGDRVSTIATSCPAAEQATIDASTGPVCFSRGDGSDPFSRDDCDSITEGSADVDAGSAGQQQNAELNATSITDAVDADCTADALDSSNCGIIAYVVIIINVLSALAGLVIVGSIMVAGYTYMTARDNAGQIMKAKMRIVWTLAALALFIFMYGLLNFLVPGGVL